MLNPDQMAFAESFRNKIFGVILEVANECDDEESFLEACEMMSAVLIAKYAEIVPYWCGKRRAEEMALRSIDSMRRLHKSGRPLFGSAI